MHTIEIDHMVFEPEEGLLLGNGDLSVSIYQQANTIIWRFGKNDVWDRRLDTSDDAEPAHIDELVRGIRDEGWVSERYTADARAKARATKGEPADEKRMQELVRGTPGYGNRPYPCPKPVGELIARLPADQLGETFTQKVTIEKGEAEITIAWESGLTYRFLCFIPPHTNALVVRWEVLNLTEESRSRSQPPVRFVLRRWADPDVEDFACEYEIKAGYWMWEGSIQSPKVTPLPPPAVLEIEGRQAIEQLFHPDIEFPNGYSYALVPYVTGLDIDPQGPFSKGDGVIHLRKKSEDVPEGWLAIAVPAASDQGGLKAELNRITGMLAEDLPGMLSQWREDTHADAADFWGKSSVEISDPLLEKMWYGILHARRCAFRADVVAPGLAFPSTVQDYSLWHGDYHTNYNYQQPFWGNLASNHVGMADSFFVGMRHLVEAGRIFAKKYFNARGTFIHLLGYPFPYVEDPYGTGGICRMMYMTGWVGSYWWWRFQYTQDEEFLREEAYPVIRDAALFYLDVLQKWDDGLYHAFPSPQGESHFTGKIETYLDQPQVIRHSRYCLQYACKAAEILGVDEDLRAEWTEIVDNMADPAGLDFSRFSEADRARQDLNFPEFNRPNGEGMSESTLKMMSTGQRIGNWAGGTGGSPRPWTSCIRGGMIEPDKAIDAMRETIRRELLRNGTCRGMGTDDMGYCGLYVEGTGMIMPLIEMMLQSWDGSIRVFPAWPSKTDCAFKTFRAEGAFLVSAAQTGGQIGPVAIDSEVGKRCRLVNPFDGAATVVDADGKAVEATIEDDNVICFDTVPGGSYEVRPA